MYLGIISTSGRRKAWNRADMSRFNHIESRWWRQLLCLMLLLGLLGACGRKKKAEGLEVVLSWEAQSDVSNESDSLLYWVTFGKETVSEEVIQRDKKGRYQYRATFDRDTIDLFLLLDDDRALLLPLRPSNSSEMTISQSKKGERTLEGVQEPELLEAYLSWRLAPTDTLPQEWRAKLEAERGHPISYIVATALEERLRQEGCTEVADELRQLATRLNQDFVPLLGQVSSPATGERKMLFPSEIQVSGKKDLVTLEKASSKTPWLAVSYLEAAALDSVAEQSLEQYQNHLDSLGVDSYHLLMACDTLPKGWKNRDKQAKGIRGAKEAQPFRYFLIDSIGEATRFIAEHYVGLLPQYLLVDSTRQVVRHWSEPDSLLAFIKAYQEIEQEVKKQKEAEEKQRKAERSKKQSGRN